MDKHTLFCTRQTDPRAWIALQKGHWCTSGRGVPYGLVHLKDERASICYMGKSDTYRFFFPFGNYRIKKDLITLERLTEFIKNFKEEDYDTN